MRYQIDVQKSSMTWHASKITRKHQGHVLLKSGWVELDDHGILSAGEIIADMNTIKDDDLTNEQLNKTLTNHLRSADFFDAASFPEAKLAVKAVHSKEGGEAMVTADMTIRGKTNEIEFLVRIARDGTAWTATGTATLDRTRWDVKYGSGKFFKGLGDSLIHDEFQLEFKLVTA